MKCRGIELEFVEHLNFRSIGLTSVRESLGDACRALQELDLSDNQLTSVASLGQFALLNKLNIASNNITTLLDIKPGSFRTLEWLDVSYNLVSVCSVFSSASVIGKLPNLKCLKAAGNELGNVPSLLGLFPQLMDLQLEHNVLTGRDLVQFASIRNLRTLNLAHNKIKVIPERATQHRSFAKLTSLDLRSNHIREEVRISLLKSLPLLTSLEMNHNSCTKNKDTIKERIEESFKEFKFHNVAANTPQRSAKNDSINTNHKHRVPEQSSDEVIQNVSKSKEHQTRDYCGSTMKLNEVFKTDLSDLDPRWNEIEDPTIKLALQIGLHPSLVGHSQSIHHLKSERIIQPISVLQQVLSRDSYFGILHTSCYQYSRPTFSSLHKLKYKP